MNYSGDLIDIARPGEEIDVTGTITVVLEMLYVHVYVCVYVSLMFVNSHIRNLFSRSTRFS